MLAHLRHRHRPNRHGQQSASRQKPPLHPSVTAATAPPSLPAFPPIRVPVTVHIRTADGEQQIELRAQPRALASTAADAEPQPPQWVLTTSISATAFYSQPRIHTRTFEELAPLIETLTERCNHAIAMNMVVAFHY